MFPHRPILQIPAACPTTELSSNSIRLELALDPTGEGLPPSQAQRPITRPDPCTSKPHPPPLPLGLIICAVPHRTQEGPLFTRSPVFDKRMQLGNSQRKTSTGQGTGEGLATPLPGAPGPVPPVYTNLEAPRTSKGRFWVCFLFFFFHTGKTN